MVIYFTVFTDYNLNSIDLYSIPFLGLLNHKKEGPTIIKSQGPRTLVLTLCISETLLKKSMKYFDTYKNVANFLILLFLPSCKTHLISVHVCLLYRQFYQLL